MERRKIEMGDPKLMIETELILIGSMASFILGLQFYGIKQIGKLCERVTRLETMLNGLRD